jgi:hypothetical protein
MLLMGIAVCGFQMILQIISMLMNNILFLFDLRHQTIILRLKCGIFFQLKSN